MRVALKTTIDCFIWLKRYIWFVGLKKTEAENVKRKIVKTLRLLWIERIVSGSKSYDFSNTDKTQLGKDGRNLLGTTGNVALS